MDNKEALGRLCRVCSRQLVTKAMKVKHICADFKQYFMEVFQISTASDNPDVYP